MASIAQRLVTLCATLGEFPHIRFAADGGGRTEGVARTFQVGVVVSCGLLPLLPTYFYACGVRLPCPSLFVMIGNIPSAWNVLFEGSIGVG